MDYRKVDPKLPSNPANPTGTQPIINEANRELVARYRKIQAQVNALIKSKNLDVEQAQKLIASIALVLDYQLLGVEPETEDDQALVAWWFADYTEQANNEGLVAAVAALALLIGKSYKRSFEAAKFSDLGLKRVELTNIANFAQFKELSEQAKADLTEIVTTAIKNETPIDEVKKQIADRLNVSLGKAKNIAQTAIPDAKREALYDEVVLAQGKTKDEIRMLWFSALTPTTRAWHRSRHKRIYTIEEVKRFYSKDGGKERWNCKCWQVPCLVDDEGKLIASPEFKATMRNQRKQWATE